MGWRGISEEYDSAGGDIVCAYKRQDASVSGRVYLLLLLDGINVGLYLGEVFWEPWSAS